MGQVYRQQGAHLRSALNGHGDHGQDLPSDADDLSDRENADFLDMVVQLSPHDHSHNQASPAFPDGMPQRTRSCSKFLTGNKAYEPILALAHKESTRLREEMQPQTSSLIQSSLAFAHYARKHSLRLHLAV